MKVTLKSGTVLEAINVEESYTPRNSQGAVLSIRVVSTDSIEVLKDRFTPAALESVTVGEGEDAKTITGYTQVDSIRKFYDGQMEYDTVVDLVKETAAA
jgi:hypothetical protein